MRATSAGSRGKVVLFMPHLLRPEHRDGDYMASPPLSILALAAPLREAGYEVVLVDQKWEPDVDALVEAHVSDAVCFGVTCLAGVSVTEGLRMAARVRGQRPELPIVWGGWHPSFVARQAAGDELVDVVVRGPGERSVVEVVDAFVEGRSLADIAGITFREAGEVVETPDRPLEDINSYPPLAYDLVDGSRYVYTRGRTRHANVIASRGCPYRCEFCLDSRNKWFGLTPDRVEQDLAYWVLGHDVNHVRFWDGNFFMGTDRIREVCDPLIHGDLAGRFEWTATGVATRIVKLDGELLTRIRRAGCHQMAIGGESGSHELLSRITNKTTVERTVEAVRMLTRHDINQYMFFMVGYPDEPEDALHDTLALIARLKAINPRLAYQVNYVIPLPGSPTFQIAVQKGLFEQPRVLADWGRLDYHQATFPTADRRYQLKVSRFHQYVRMGYPPVGIDGSPSRALIAASVFEPLRRLARWRVDRQFFDFPVEAMLTRAWWGVRRLVGSAP